MTIAVSIVSHGHGAMLNSLIEQLASFKEVNQIILTINIPEGLEPIACEKLEIIKNESPKGFGTNHNAAFHYCRSDYYCVLNPDIEFTENPFSALLQTIKNPNVGIVAPAVVNKQGFIEDSARRFPTLFRLLKRQAGISDAYRFNLASNKFAVDWVAGMFILFPMAFYKALGGFDESYYMYCEDVDICQRTWLAGRKVVLNPKVSVIHDARRASRKNLKHLRWHLYSMYLFLSKRASATH